MQMCPYCNSIYDESEFCGCPYCSGLLERKKEKLFYKKCPKCNGIMYWYDDCWGCTNCGEDIYSDEDDWDGIIEG